MKNIGYLATFFALLVILFLTYFYNNRTNNYRSVIEEIEFEVGTLKNNQLELIKVQEQDLSSRIRVERMFNSIDVNKSFSFNSSSLYLYIPQSICNDCMTSIYEVIKSSKEEHDLHVIVLSPKITFRENLAYFSDLGFEIQVFEPPIKESLNDIFLFKYNNCFTNFMIIRKNEIGKCMAYIRSLVLEL